MSNATSDQSEAAPPALRHNTLGQRHAIVISVAVMSPAASIFFNTIPQASFVGAAIPLCYVIGFIVALLVANQYSEFARELPSSGSAYTFVSEGLGPHMGFLTGWVGLLAIALGVPYSFILLAANLQTLMVRWFGFTLHWSFWFVLILGIAFALCYWGARQSMNIDLLFLVVEIGICLVLAALVLFRVGQKDGFSAVPFSLAAIPPGGNLVVGVILSVLSFIGFETAAALGEETQDPHKSIPRAVFGSMVVVGIFYILMAYAGTLGYGIQRMATSFANDPAPFDTITRQYGGPLLVVLIDLVGIFSFFSAALAIINGGARIIYSVGRNGLLPAWMALLHRTRGTPIGAITLLCIFGLVVGLWLGFAMTPIGAFGFLGTLDSLFIMVIYALVCIAGISFFWRKRRAQFRLLRHGIVPALGTLFILVIIILLIVSSTTAPLNFIPYILLGWLLIGGALLFVLRKKMA